MSGLNPKNFAVFECEYVKPRKPPSYSGGLAWTPSMDAYDGKIIAAKEFVIQGRYYCYMGWLFEKEWLHPVSAEEVVRFLNRIELNKIDEKYDSMIKQIKDDFELRKKNYKSKPVGFLGWLANRLGRKK